MLTGKWARPLPEYRFWKKTDIDFVTGCWNWVGAENGVGYGLLHVNHRNVYVHRFSYESFKGKIPQGLVIDHLCRNSSCVNPEHLEVVSKRVNTLRGTGQAARNAKKTHCPKGHPLSGVNLLINNRNERHCKKCTQAINSKSYAKHVICAREIRYAGYEGVRHQ